MKPATVCLRSRGAQRRKSIARVLARGESRRLVGCGFARSSGSGLSSLRSPLLHVLGILVTLLASACDLGTPQSSIRGVTQSAPEIPEFNDRGDYTPYYSTGELNTPRYFHHALVAANGLVYVFGGSDERGLAGLDSVEIFDQSTTEAGELPPESRAGVWIDTNFEGDPIIMPSGARMLMTATELSDNTVILIGGTQNLLGSNAISKVELFDPQTRDFATLEVEMQIPRFRHTTVRLALGDLLIVGGQLQEFVTVEDPNTGGIPGQGPTQQQVSVFPSISESEVFSARENDFVLLKTINGDTSELQTQRGRAGHAMTRLSGPDNRLDTSDDIYMVVGGFQTLSAESGNAPDSKAPGAVGRQEADALTTIEVFDPLTNIFTLIASVKLDAPRVLTPEAVNLGRFNDFTPDGVLGMGNAVLITNGEDDFTSPTSALPDQVFIANYTPGAGPAQGVRFFEVVDDRFLSYLQNIEYFDPQVPSPAALAVARFATNTVSLPRPLNTVQGVEGRGTWVFSLAGATADNGAVDYDSPAMLAGCVFDPFFSLRAAFLSNLEPTNLENERRTEPLNYLGIVGVWMTIDSDVTQSIDDFGTTPDSRWARNRGERRVLHTAVQLAGVDGIRNTFDDRVLLAGGGRDFLQQGGEPTSPSAEIFLPPGSASQ